MTYEEALQKVTASEIQLDGIDPRIQTQSDGIHLSYKDNVWEIRTQERGGTMDSARFDDTEISVEECLKGIDAFLFKSIGKHVDTELLKNVVLNKPEDYEFNWDYKGIK